MSQPDVVIGIPTFRRHLQLGALLRSLSAEINSHRVAAILVADNDCDATTAAAVADDAVGLPPVQVLGVPERGLSQVRNALLTATYDVAPDWRWLIMLDDDGLVLPGWFAALIDTAERFDADLAGGPVLGQLPPGSSRLARNSIYGGRPRFPTGPVSCLNCTQNIVIARRIADRLGPPWFRPDLGLVGSEDYEFFRRVGAAGGRLIWCDDACINEPTPGHRLTTPSILKRAFYSNVVNGGVDAEYGLHPSVRGYVLPLGRRLAREMCAGVARRDLDRLTRTGIEAVAMAGRATGLARSRRRGPGARLAPPRDV
ncbi:MAG: glycosyltransferase [Austwickia sp.]|jgi:succinoglycan biosynthesis protein ExoM|nr:MAG: glycosyltransferase [Austwickia sp.]